MVAEIDEIIMKPTSFSAIYNCFLSQITDDMYLEMTPEDTIKDLQSLLVQVIPHFEFPRIPLVGNYVIETKIVNETEVTSEDFILEIIQDELPEDEIKEAPDVLIECSHFNVNLTPEEINILALLMKEAWVKRQLYSVEVTRMKYTGTD